MGKISRILEKYGKNLKSCQENFGKMLQILEIVDEFR